MTTAEKIVAGDQKPPKAVLEAAEAAQARAHEQAEGLRSEAGQRELLRRAHVVAVQRLAAAAEGGDKSAAAMEALRALSSGQVTEFNAATWSGLTRAQAVEVRDTFVDDMLTNGCYAYSFHRMPDGSIVAVYVTGEDAEVGYEAFADMGETAEWHPVRAPRET